MRSVTLLSVLSLATIAALGVACAPSSEDDNANDQTQDVTGGSGAVESPVVYLFEGADKTLLPKCAGAMLSDTIAVTVKACAPKTGMVVGRATDDDGKGDERASVKTLHTPPGADADIVVVELDRPLKGTHAVITHIPLRDGYAVNGVAAADERGIFSPLSPKKGEASSINGKLISETDTHASITPEKGSTICAGDIGAPVCSSTGMKILNWNITGTCGLSGLIVGPSDVAAAPVQAATGSEAPKAPATNTATCTSSAWKVVELGRYADFLRPLAPGAFKPVIIDKPIIRNFPSVPDGLWGWKTKGELQSCKIETPKLDTAAVNGSSKVTAKVFFKNMEEKAKAYGRFGIAPKSAPSQMRWLPAKASAEQSGNNFELTFEGSVGADKDGEYIVGFRASATGGETWSLCGIEGIEKGTAIEKGLGLKVGNAPATPTEPGSGTTPSDAPNAPTGDYSDPPSEPSSSSSDGDLPSSSSDGDPTGEGEEDSAVAKKKKTDSSGCSAAPSSSSTSSSAAMLGLVLGALALVRRRRHG